MKAIEDPLREVPLFADLSRRDLRQLAASMSEQVYADGDEVVAQGKSGVAFFVILSGRARVTQDGEEIGVLSGGDYFGEMALIDGDHRAASVHADGDLRCGALTTWNFRPFVRDHPDVAWALLTALVKRLRETQARGVAARD